MSENAIIIKNLFKVYRLYSKPIDRLKEAIRFSNKKEYSIEFKALNDITFSIRRGEIVGLIGKNGAGKSTLLKIITGVLTQTSGEVTVNGTVSALLELGAGFNPEYTGMQNIYLNGSMMGLARNEIDKIVDEIIRFADIGDFIYQPVKSYSSGMFARLAFAVAISVRPDILIVDEALAVGDTRFQIKCMDYMKKMMQMGTTVLFVSHDINAIRRFCQRALWIDNGCIIMDGEVNRICDTYMDFLKCDIIDIKEKAEEVNEKLIHTETRSANNQIAEIVSFTVKDKEGIVGENIWYDEPLSIEIIYEVYDSKVKNPVVGVAIRSADDDYTCGLNTLLDKVKISWKQGKNKIVLHYPLGIRAVGGKYYFEVAIEDQTASVGIHYIQRVQSFNMIMDYKCEGRYNIPHSWEVEE